LSENYDTRQIFDVVLAFNSQIRYEDMLDLILNKMMEITRSDAGTLYTIEQGKLNFRIIKNKTLGIHQTADLPIDLPPIELDKNNIKNVSAYSAIKNEVVVIKDVYEENHHFNFSGPKNYDKITGYRTRSMLVLPLTTYWNNNVEILGVIQLINATDPATKQVVPYGNIFSPPVIPALANVAANTLANLIHLREVRQLFKSFVTSMVQTIEEHSRYNNTHTQRVSELCTAFAAYLSSIFEKGHPYHFDDVNVEELTMAAMLHDIGKVLSPVTPMDKDHRLGERLPVVRKNFDIKLLQLEVDLLRNNITREEYDAERQRCNNALSLVETAAFTSSLTDDHAAEIQKLSELVYRNSAGKTVPILEAVDIEMLVIRKGTLTSGERASMEEHASITNRILQNIAFVKYYKNAGIWAGSTHDFLDSSGYPVGLKGDSLTPEICIITIMDIFEALVASDRPYKKALSVDKAMQIITEMADDGKLHKELVKLFKQSKVWEAIM